MKLNRILNNLLFVVIICLFSRASLYACDASEAGAVDSVAAQISVPGARRQQYTSDCLGTVAPGSAADHASLVASQQDVGAQEGIDADFIQMPFTVNQALLEAAKNLDLSGIEQTLRDGANINAQNEEIGFTALMYVLLGPWIEPSEFNEKFEACFERLLDTQGIDVAIQDFQGDTALTHAVRSHKLTNKCAVVKRLIDLGANINHRGEEGMSILVGAILTESDELIDLLLNQPGIDLNAALKYLDAEECRGGYVALSKRYASRYADIFAAVIANDALAMRGFIFAGADVNLQNDCGHTALMLAIQFGEMMSIRIIDRLLETPDIDVNFQNIHGDTALFYALSNNSLGVDFRVLLVKRLIDLGADINHHNRIEERPVLAEAVLTESDELIDVLLNRPRIDINAALEYLDIEGYCDGYAALLKRCARR